MFINIDKKDKARLGLIQYLSKIIEFNQNHLIYFRFLFVFRYINELDNVDDDDDDDDDGDEKINIRHASIERNGWAYDYRVHKQSQHTCDSYFVCFVRTGFFFFSSCSSSSQSLFWSIKIKWIYRVITFVHI